MEIVYKYDKKWPTLHIVDCMSNIEVQCLMEEVVLNAAVDICGNSNETWGSLTNDTPILSRSFPQSVHANASISQHRFLPNALLFINRSTNIYCSSLQRCRVMHSTIMFMASSLKRGTDERIDNCYSFVCTHNIVLHFSICVITRW
jgi:hypothetical protein